MHIHLKCLHATRSKDNHTKKLCYKHSAGMLMLQDQASLKEACDLRASSCQ